MNFRARSHALLSIIFDICRLRRGPQDVPYSPMLLATAVAACVILQLMLAALRGLALGDAFASALLWLAFTLMALHVMLGLRALRSRFVQAATALLFCTLVFAILSLPIVLLAGEPPMTPEHMSPQQLLLGFVALLLLIWKVVVNAHVLRHSLDLPFLSGLVIALLWIVVGIVLSISTGTPTGA